MKRINHILITAMVLVTVAMFANADIPPAPVGLNNDTGNYWVNYTWSKDLGCPDNENVTDSFNVSMNGTWHNGTATFLNKSVGSGGWANIMVWAYNRTGNGNMSVDSVSDNVQAPAMVDPPDDNPCTIMHPDSETLREWMESYNAAPKVNISGGGVMAFPDEYSVLGRLDYNATERDQGGCGNCWVWAATGCMEVAHDVENDVFDRLSIQYLNSLYYDGTGADHACCGGNLDMFANFYSVNTTFAVPWNNTNASWQDGNIGCTDSTTVPAASIATMPHYTITRIEETTITTHDIEQAAAIANIKNVLASDNAVWFAFFLPNSTDWDDFYTFWNTGSEIDLWSPDYSCGHTWGAGGGGHAVLCVGYNDSPDIEPYWIMLNSWGASANRPNGLFRMNMSINYDCYFVDGGNHNSLWWQMLDIDFAVPTPMNLQSTTGNYWVNYTWTAGTGIVTDGYNVSMNGWHNGTETFLNSSVGAGNWSNITVWAWNATGNGNMSEGNISDNVQAPSAAAELPCTCGDICVNTSGWWRDGGAFNASDTPIQAAVNAATAGETICVAAGSYEENVLVNKQLTLAGEGADVVTVAAPQPDGDHVFEVTTDYVNISGFNVTGATGNATAGIYLGSGVDHCNISNNTASNNRCGIILNSSSNNTLSNNNAAGNFGGIGIGSSSNNMLSNNTASGNFYGIGIWSASNNTLTSNTANSNDWAGIYLNSSSNNNTLTSNTALNNSCGICLGYSSNNTLSNNTASNNSFGVSLYYSSNNTLSNNTAGLNAHYGIYLQVSSNNNTLTNNTASNDVWDIYIEDSSSIFEDNTLNGTTVSFTYSGDVSLKGVGSPAADPSGRHSIGKFINATNQTGGAWLYLNFSYSTADVGGLDEPSLAVWKYNGTVWLEDGWNGTRYLDEGNNMVGVNITTFSVFAPMVAVAYIPPAPTNLNNTTGNYWVNYTWSEGSDPENDNVTDSFNVCMNGTWTNETTDTFMNVTVGPSGWANITVWAYNASGAGTLSAGSISDEVQAPAPPAPAITAWDNNKTNNDSTTITINESESVRFNATADQTIDTWHWYNNGTFVQSNNFDNYTTSWSVNGTNTVSVNATNDANGTSGTKTWTVTVTDITAPDRVKDLANDTPTTSTVNLSWTANTEADLVGYRVYRNGTLIDSLPKSQTSCNVMSLSSSTTYEFNVSAYDDNDLEGENASRTVTTAATVHPAPAITAWDNNKTNNDSTTITINESESVRFEATADQTIDTWHWYNNGTDQLSNFDNYITSWSVNGTNTVSVNATNDANGTTNMVTWTVTVTDITAPKQVQGLTNDTPTTSTVDLSWTANTGSDLVGYRVYQNGTLLGSTVNAYYNATGLSSSTTYKFNVSAYDDNDLEGENASRTVTTAVGPLHHIDVTPDFPQTLGIDESQNFTATGRDQNEGKISGLVFAWARSDVSIGSLTLVNATTMNFTADHVGVTYITASNGSVTSDPAQVTVNGATNNTTVTNEKTFTATSGDANVTGSFTINVTGWVNATAIGNATNSPEVNQSNPRSGLGYGDKVMSGVIVNVSSNITEELAKGNGTIHIQICYNATMLTALGIDASTLAIWKYNSTTEKWVQQSSGISGRCVYADVKHLCTFALVGSKATGGSTGSGGTYPPGWFGTPTVTATKAPAASATTTDAPPGERVTPAATKKPAAAKTDAPAAEGTTAGDAKKGAPGFTAVFVIAGMLAIAYAMMRRRG